MNSTSQERNLWLTKDINDKDERRIPVNQVSLDYKNV